MQGDPLRVLARHPVALGVPSGRPRPPSRRRRGSARVPRASTSGGHRPGRPRSAHPRSPAARTLRTFCDAPDVIAQPTSRSGSTTKPIGTTCGVPSARRVVTVHRWRSDQKSRNAADEGSTEAVTRSSSPTDQKGATVTDPALVAGRTGWLRPAWAADGPAAAGLLRHRVGHAGPRRARASSNGSASRRSSPACPGPPSCASGRRSASAFDGFDPDVVAGYDEADVRAADGRRRHRPEPAQGAGDDRQRPGHPRPRAEDGGLAELVWSFRPASTPAPTTYADVPAPPPESVALAKTLREQGVRVRRADHDVRADGGGRHRRHPPGRQPPPGHARGLARSG